MSRCDSERDAAVDDCKGFGQAPHVTNSPLRRCCVQVVHAENDLRFQWVPLSSDSGLGNVEVLGKRQHQDWVAHDVTIVLVPLVCQASAFLKHVPRIMSTCELFWPTKQKICRFLQSGRVVHSESLFLCIVVHANPKKGVRRLPGCNTSSRLRRHHAQSQTALQGAVKISLLCTSILWLWREPFLFNMGQVLMFPRCCCRVLWEKPRRRLAHCLPLNHSKAVFLASFILASGFMNEPVVHSSFWS